MKNRGTFAVRLRGVQWQADFEEQDDAITITRLWRMTGSFDMRRRRMDRTTEAIFPVPADDAAEVVRQIKEFRVKLEETMASSEYQTGMVREYNRGGSYKGD